MIRWSEIGLRWLLIVWRSRSNSHDGQYRTPAQLRSSHRDRIDSWFLLNFDLCSISIFAQLDRVRLNDERDDDQNPELYAEGRDSGGTIMLPVILLLGAGWGWWVVTVIWLSWFSYYKDIWKVDSHLIVVDAILAISLATDRTWCDSPQGPNNLWLLPPVTTTRAVAQLRWAGWKKFGSQE